jgi:ribulose-phosphate 3-epimerase
MEKKISPSLMCCDFTSLGEQLSLFEREKIEYLHVDVMDGAFVPNFTLGTDFVKQLKKNCMH